MDDIAGRIVLIVDASVPAGARAACDDAAAALAQRAGMPVTLAAVPIETLDAVQPVLRRGPGQIRDVEAPSPGAMASAPFVWRRDGRPDWGAMWTTFCDLALHGGPPQRGALQALRGPAIGDRAAGSAPEISAELRRGIEETTGLATEPGGPGGPVGPVGPAEPGWIAITCASPRMAAWLCATIILENVDARMEGPRLFVPAGPGFALEDQVRSVITVVAKTHHYWREHLESARETRS
jgi:sirohydrochlorin cobaltochelatase